MIRNYLKVALRNFSRNKIFSFINITGLSIGMAVAILIGLWIRDELSFNMQYENFPRIAQVMQNQTFNGETGTQRSLPFPIGDQLKKNSAATLHMSACRPGTLIISFLPEKIKSPFPDHIWNR
jgi:putative ABC transport system permease protein